MFSLWLWDGDQAEAQEEGQAGADSEQAKRRIPRTVVEQVTPTQAILTRDGHQCAYGTLEKPCRATTIDHLITRAAARRTKAAALLRDDPQYIVACCLDHNVAKGTLLRVPESHGHLIDELEALTLSTYAVWDGQARTLYEEVVR